MTFGQKLSRPVGGGTMRPLTAELRLLFNLGEVDSRITTTRASTKTRFNEFGIMETVPANTLSIDYDPSALRTSSTSATVALGTKTLVLSSSGFALGDAIRVTRTGDVATFMAGKVVYISGTTIKVDVKRIGGSGTYTDWQVIKCNGAHIEESVTKVVLYSDTFDNTSGWSIAGATVSANSATAPDNTVTMDKLVENTATSAHSIAVAPAVRPTIAAGAHVEAFFVKSGGRNRFTLFNNGSSGEATVLYDVSTGTVVATGGAQYLASGIKHVGSDIYLCWRAFTSLGGTTAPSIYLARDSHNTASIDNYTGDGVSGIYLWRASSEIGSYPSSSVATTTSSVARNADVVVMSGINFSDWYNPVEGTFVVDYIEPQNSNSVLYIGDDTNNNRIFLTRDGGGTTTYVVSTSGVSQAVLTKSTVTPGSKIKAALAYKANDFGYSRNGDVVLTDTSGTIPVVNQMRIGQSISTLGTYIFDSYLQRIDYYTVRLPNDQLRVLST